MATIQARLDLEPADAVAYFAAKQLTPSWSYLDTWGSANVRQFVVAKATTLDVLAAINEETAKAINGQITFQDFVKTLRPRLMDLGWWGRQEVLDGETGEITSVQLGSLRRLRTIFQTNVQTAYMAGRYKRYLEGAASHPYWRYTAIMDGRTRPEHAALHGRVWRYDDPVWQVIWPPNGWGCRCRVQALTEAQFKALGVPLENGSGAIVPTEVVINKAGDTVTVQGVRYKDAFGREQVFLTDPGWDYNPGAEFVRIQQLLDMFARKAARVPAPMAATVARDLMVNGGLTAMLDRAWISWVGTVFADPVTRKREMVVGFMRPVDVAALAERGVLVEDVAIAVQDSRLVGGAKAARHLARGNALSQADWDALSQQIRQPQAVLWQSDGQRLLYVLAADGGQAQRVVVAPNYMQHGRAASDNLRTAYWTNLEDLRADVRGGLLELIEGHL